MENNENETKDISFHIKDKQLSFSYYPKAKNLITALFMVTDIMDKEEIIRNKLRTTGLEIISDIYDTSYRTEILFNNLSKKTSLALSLLDIATDLKMITNMNSSILKREFNNMKLSLEEAIRNTNDNDDLSLLSLFKEEDIEIPKRKLFEVMNPYPLGHNGQEKVINKYNGQAPTNIGVQKGSTLLKALQEIENKAKSKGINSKKIEPKIYDKNNVKSAKTNRQDEIVKIVNSAPNGLTITDIKTKARGELAVMSEKTLQRQLVAMVANSVLYKTGEKRWSRYFIQK